MYVFVMYYVYGVFGSSLLIESTDSMMVFLNQHSKRHYTHNGELEIEYLLLTSYRKLDHVLSSKENNTRQGISNLYKHNSY